MAYYQNTSVDSDRLIVGNWKMETAATAGATFVNMGAGQMTAWQHQIEKYDVQAGNAPDPIEGIARETLTFGFDLIEYDASVLSALQNGLVTHANTSTHLTTISAGGNATLTPRAYKLTNTRMVSTTTVETIITIFKGAIDNGATMVTKSDNDTDPINVLQFSITADLDTTRSVGSQLYTMTHVET